MRYRTRRISSVGALLHTLKQQADPKRPVWFRGQGRKEWRLIPSLAREASHLKAEGALIKRFMQNAAAIQGANPPRDEWEWMVLMQHHRAPTRLLDWTESPLVALYFAAEETKNSSLDGAVWCLDPLALNKAANLTFKFEAEIPAFGRDRVLKSYLPSRVAENPAKLFPVAIIEPRNTPRMSAQLGVFTINHRRHTPIEAIGDRKQVWRWIIPAEAKPEIMRELVHLAFSDLTLFPELDKVASLSRKILE